MAITAGFTIIKDTGLSSSANFTQDFELNTTNNHPSNQSHLFPIIPFSTALILLCFSTILVAGLLTPKGN